MPNAHEPSIVVSADTSGFETAMRDIAATTEQFGHVFGATMRRAVLSGRDLDDTLRSIALRFADLTLARSLSPIENALSGMLGGLVSGLVKPGSGSSDRAASTVSKVIFNVTSPDAAGFSRSEAQISALLARAVGRGRRSL